MQPGHFNLDGIDADRIHEAHFHDQESGRMHMRGRVMSVDTEGTGKEKIEEDVQEDHDRVVEKVTVPRR